MTLRIYAVAIEMVRAVAPVVTEIGRSDADLARQLRRAAVSVPLNLAEGSRGRGGNRKARYATALGSAEEVRACLDVAEAMGAAKAIAPALRAMLRELVGTLVKLAR